jgi:hypothetical protein
MGSTHAGIHRRIHGDTPMNFEQWLRYGVENFFCGPIVCDTHDGAPMTEDEDDQFQEGYDPCVPVIRVYDSPYTAALVEENHVPTRQKLPQQK